MQTTFQLPIIAAITLLIFAGFGCQGERTQSLNFKQGVLTDALAIDSMETHAICIYDKVGLRLEATRNKYLPDGTENIQTLVRYGEKVEWLKQYEPIESKNTLFIKIRLKDGTEGWAFDYALEKDARRGTVIKPTPIYRRPDRMTLRNDTLMPGEIIAILSRQDDWLHVSGRNKWKKGWIRVEDNVSMRETDVYVALLLNKALTSPEEGREDQLNNILQDQSLTASILIPLVKENIERSNGANAGTNNDSLAFRTLSASEQRFFITSNAVKLHGSPSSDSTNVMQVLNHGDVGRVLEKGSQQPLDGANDYWYKVEISGQEGWVYGYFTSLRKI